MDKVSIALSALVSVALVIMIAPRVLAANRGVALRNVALWVAIFLGLALFYRHFGPGAAGIDSTPAFSSSNEELPL